MQSWSSEQAWWTQNLNAGYNIWPCDCKARLDKLSFSWFTSAACWKDTLEWPELAVFTSITGILLQSCQRTVTGKRFECLPKIVPWFEILFKVTSSFITRKLKMRKQRARAGEISSHNKCLHDITQQTERPIIQSSLFLQFYRQCLPLSASPLDTSHEIKVQLPSPNSASSCALHSSPQVLFRSTIATWTTKLC